MTRKEIVKAIRSELKNNGITNRQVGVTSKAALYDDSITVTIKDLNVNYKVVKEIAEQHESIRYDEYNGEILAGCNVYICVKFDYDVVQEAKQAYILKAEELIEAGKDYKEGSLMTIASKGNLTISYSPKWCNGNPAHIELCEKPEGWENKTCYCLDTVQRYDAQCKENIAEALLMFACQYGINVLEEQKGEIPEVKEVNTNNIHNEEIKEDNALTNITEPIEQHQDNIAIEQNNINEVKEMNINILVFEGAGIQGTGSKEIPNCRIRTRILNNNGRVIYLELGGTTFQGKHIPNFAKDFKVTGHVDYCFYCDSEWDNNSNYSDDFNSEILHGHFEYNKGQILKFVNEKLNCSFKDIVVDYDLKVHNTKEPLCSCCNKEYTPYKDKEYNINLLQHIKPIREYRGYIAEYKLSYDFIQQIPSLKKYIDNSSETDKQRYPNYTFYAQFRYNKDGIIKEMNISARQNFLHMGMSLSMVEQVINELNKKYKVA